MNEQNTVYNNNLNLPNRNYRNQNNQYNNRKGNQKHWNISMRIKSGEIGMGVNTL